MARCLSPTQSSINPYYWPPDAESGGIVTPQDEPRKFAYGHLPLYLGVAATRLAEWAGPKLLPILPDSWQFAQDILNGGQRIEYRHLTAVARALTGLVDVGTVFLLFLLGRRMWGTAVGLLAAAFLAINVMHIQLAHFFTVDPYLTFFTTAALYLLVVSAEHDAPSGQKKWFLLAAAAVGLAVGSKFAGTLLFVPLLVTAWWIWRERWWLWLGTAVLAAFFAFAVTNPFALLDFSCEIVTPALDAGPLHLPSFDWGSCFLDNIAAQGGMVRGKADLPFTRQYDGTRPFLYFIEMQLRWGMGPLLGLLAFAGLGWLTWKTAVFRQNSSFTPHPSSFILLSFILPYFLTTGSFFVKFMRYLQPITPILMLLAAALLWQVREKRRRWSVTAVVLTATTIFALSFVNLYDDPHPWNAASLWIYENVEPETLTLSEQWDDALPVSLDVDGKRRRRGEYENAELTWLTGTGAADDEAKLTANLALLAEAEYLTIVSNRAYGVIPRLPARYPLSSQYHLLLFDGALGYELVYVNGRFPHIAGFSLKPDTFSWPDVTPPTAVNEYLNTIPGVTWGRADESFTVYDQPLTMIFQNKGKLTVGEMRKLFEGTD